MITALIATAVLFLLAVWLPPALEAMADLSAAGITETKAPWFFLAIQEMLRYVSPLWAGWIIPLAGLAFLALIPFIDRRGPGRGEWFAKDRWQVQVAFAGLMAVIIILTLVAALR